MASRGRPPKPSVIAFLQGDPGKRRRYQVEPAAPDGPPSCPDHLDDVAKAEWFFICGVLKDMGLLSRADRTALTCYVEAWSRYRKALDHVQRFGAVILSPTKKYPMVSPYETVMRKALKDVMTFLTEFGLTPAARARMRVESRSETEGGKWKGLVG